MFRRDCMHLRGASCLVSEDEVAAQTVVRLVPTADAGGDGLVLRVDSYFTSDFQRLSLSCVRV